MMIKSHRPPAAEPAWGREQEAGSGSKMLPRPPPSGGPALPRRHPRTADFQVCRLAGFTTRSASEHWRRSDLVPLPTILPLLGERARGEGGRISPGGAALPRRPLWVFAPCTPEPPSRPAFARLRQPIHFRFLLSKFRLLPLPLPRSHRRSSASVCGQTRLPGAAPPNRVKPCPAKNKKSEIFVSRKRTFPKTGCFPIYFSFFNFAASRLH